MTAAAGDENTLTIDPFNPLPPATTEALEEQGQRLLAFVAGEGDGGRVEPRINLT